MAISFRWCEGGPKRTHNPEGNCQRCFDPFHDPRLYICAVILRRIWVDGTDFRLSARAGD